MASIVDKYEQILAADPRSRIFVELAKVLVDRGDHVRAIEVCQRGLEHHPSSILGRVVWGRALLEAGDVKAAMDQFEIAIALEPSSPYAYNHIGEALLKKELFREALPVLARAAELQPADARVRGWLEEAKRRARGEAPAPAGGGTQPVDETTETTEPYRPIVARAGSGDGEQAGAESERGTGSSAEEGAAAPDAGPAGEGEAPAAAPDAAPDPAADAATDAAGDAAPGETVSQPPPLPPGATPPPMPKRQGPPSVLNLIPGGPHDEAEPPAGARARSGAAAPARRDDRAEAERIAKQYEHDLRKKLAAAPEAPPSFLDRHRRLVVLGAIAIALGAAGGVYLYLDHRNTEMISRTAASRGRAGLARDTLGSLREAHRVLSVARRRGNTDPEVLSLAAQVAAVFATDYGDEGALGTARTLAADPAAGDGAVAARWLVAPGDAERKQAEADVLAPRPSPAPLLQALAGRILVRKGELEGGRGRLELAARANPPLLRAISDLGDAALASGDADGALSFYGSALAAQPTHARSVVGAAEARLSLARDLDVARKELARVETDPTSAPPKDLRTRFEVTYARVLVASGQATEGAARLQKAAQELGESATIAAGLADVQLAAHAWEQAEAAAARAVRLEPKDAAFRVLLARARIGRGRFREALEATDGQEGRGIRVQRAIARFQLGQFAQVREEVEKTVKDGKMPAEAAVWYALADVATGRAERAVPLLEKLAASANPPPLAHVALGRAREAKGDAAGAEQAYRAATEREPNVPEGHLALGTFLVEHGRAKDALPSLEKAVKLNGSDLGGRRARGEARLAAGEPAAARADLDFVLLATPKDAGAATLLSAAWLAEGQPAEARRAAERAVELAPRSPAGLVAAARASLAAGDGAAARRYAERGLKAGATGEAAVDARRILGDTGKTKTKAKAQKKR